MNEINKILL